MHLFRGRGKNKWHCYSERRAQQFVEDFVIFKVEGVAENLYRNGLIIKINWNVIANVLNEIASEEE